MNDLVTAYIALGSNIGDRQANLDVALAKLRDQAGVTILRVSTYHDTAPVGGPPGQDRYLNAVAEIRTSLRPMELMRLLLAIEARLGRVRTERFGPRIIDLDLILFGNEVIDAHEPDCEVTVPHPRMHERSFVLAPLVEIAPLAVHPVLQSTVKDLLARLSEPANPGRELHGQNAVVTGSTSGIGRAIALTLAQAGANVVIHGRRSQDAADAVTSECRQHHVSVHSLLADLRESVQCAQLVEQCRQQLGVIDIWINNAGADTLTGDAARWSFEHKLQELWSIDVRATLQLSRLVGDLMKQQGHGAILNMGWDQADTGMDGDSGQLFGACKGAVMAFTKSLALSVAPKVRVNCLAPGWIRTAWGEHASDAWQQRVLAETPLKRWGAPEDVAATARWLVGPAARFITGQVVNINGGAVR
ncbi:MAG TPA: 2-amino-4-hydroxy-6-hydroxymethyldihydropteridine diphosphokinase [Gemmataceae bacterium]|nr:2-amino-4-hydroxy-6-hydroxymethyldihydropteridine diphosphokinase [Gemmataceae bacterium]